MMPNRTFAASSLSLALACLALGGCVKLGQKPPPRLLTISADAALPSGQSVSSAGIPTVMVVTPEVPHKIDTMRVPVQINATAVAYVKDAQWSDTPRRMFARLLIDTIAAGGEVFVVSSDQYGMPAGARLSGELVDFGVDARTREAVVIFDAVLAKPEGDQAVRRRFTARAPVRDIEADKVAEPINRAANQVAVEVAAWVKGG